MTRQRLRQRVGPTPTWWIVALAGALTAGVLRGHAAAVTGLVIAAAVISAATCLGPSLRVASAAAATTVGVAVLHVLDPAQSFPSRLGLSTAIGVAAGLGVAAIGRLNWRLARPLGAVTAAVAVAMVPVAAQRSVPAQRSVTAAPRVLNVDAAERYLRSEVEGGRLPGLAFGASEHGVPVRLVAFGTTGPRGPEMRPSTQFRIGSMSKSFTALAVTQLAAEGKLALDDPIHQYLRWPKQSRVTIRQLLQHTSGIPNSAGWQALAGRADIDRDIARGFSDVDIREPGVAEYSNANYILAGRIIESVTGTDYATHLDAAVLRPLGLSDTTGRRPAARNHATGYRFWYGVSVPSTAPFLDFAVPAGFITSNVPDLLTYISAVVDRRRPEVPSAARGELLTFDAIAPDEGPAAEPFPGHRYGLGWVNGRIGGVDVVWHSGGIADFNSVMVSDPSGEWAFVILINTASQLARLMPTITKNVIAALHDEAPTPNEAAGSLALTYLGFVIALIATLAALALLTIAARRQPRARAAYASIAFAGALIAVVAIGLPGATGFPVHALSIESQTDLNRVLRTYVPDVGWAAILLLAAASLSMALSLHSTVTSRRTAHLGIDGRQERASNDR